MHQLTVSAWARRTFIGALLLLALLWGALFGNSLGLNGAPAATNIAVVRAAGPDGFGGDAGEPPGWCPGCPTPTPQPPTPTPTPTPTPPPDPDRG